MLPRTPPDYTFLALARAQGAAEEFGEGLSERDGKDRSEKDSGRLERSVWMFTNRHEDREHHDGAIHDPER